MNGRAVTSDMRSIARSFRDNHTPNRNEVLGTYSRQSQRVWLELGLNTGEPTGTELPTGSSLPVPFAPLNWKRNRNTSQLDAWS
jgi:hypothetical protein